MKRQLREIHGALLDLTAMLNRPQEDDVLLKEAGVALDRALFPLLVRIERRGPIGVVELAQAAGRDYTTVSRQVAKLKELGLITRRADPKDRRVHAAEVTAEGLVMTKALDRARERLAESHLARWSLQDLSELARLLRKLADELGPDPSAPHPLRRSKPSD